MRSQSFKKVIFSILFVFVLTLISLNFAVASSFSDNIISLSMVTSNSSGNTSDYFLMNNDDHEGGEGESEGGEGEGGEGGEGGGHDD